MIPTRRPRIRRASESEITDDDIIEVQPQPRSGTYPAVHPPPVPTESSDPVVRYSLDSLTDDEDVHIDTAMNDVNVSLARLALEDKTASAVQLRGAVEWNDLSPEEAWVVTLATSGFDLQAVIANSPRSEEDTLTLLSRLIEMRVITLVPAR